MLKLQIAQLQAIIEQNKPNHHTEAPVTVDIATNNRFEMLLDMEDEDTIETNKGSLLENMRKKNAKKRTYEEPTPSSSQSNYKLSNKDTNQVNSRREMGPENEEGNTKSKKTKEYKPPPIHIELQDPKDTAKLLVEELGLSKFHIKRINSNKHLLQLDTENNFTKSKELLKKAGMSFYSYTPKENKLPTYVLKGLHNTYTEEEIFKELKSLQLDDITFCNVTRLSTKRSKEGNFLLPIYIIQLTPGSNTSKLKQIQYINYQIVKWEKLIKRVSAM